MAPHPRTPAVAARLGQPSAMEPLTKKQQQVWDLSHSTPPLNSTQVAERLGCSSSYVRRTLKVCREKLGLEIGYVKPPHGRAIERKEPERAAKAMDLVTDPFRRSLKRIAAECGLPKATMDQFMRRLEARYAPIKLAVESVKTEELLGLAADRAKRVVESISEHDIGNASLKDKSISFGILLDKRELLAGRATQNVSVKQRVDLTVLLGKLKEEIERRNPVEVCDPETGKVTIAEATSVEPSDASARLHD